jgi:hypothetical protein
MSFTRLSSGRHRGGDPAALLRYSRARARVCQPHSHPGVWDGAVLVRAGVHAGGLLARNVRERKDPRRPEMHRYAHGRVLFVWHWLLHAIPRSTATALGASI